MCEYILYGFVFIKDGMCSTFALRRGQRIILEIIPLLVQAGQEKDQ
jgi:hypothetical protein